VKKYFRRTKMKRIFVVLLALALAGGMAFATGGRQAASGDALGDYPNKPIRCIVPFAPGGGTDVFVRTVLKYTETKQPIAVVNIEGASGLVGGMEGYNSPNDGYTIIAHMPVDLVTFTLGGQSQIPLWSELEQICWAVQDFDGFFASKDSGFRNYNDVVNFARANPGRISWGTLAPNTKNRVMARQITDGLGIANFVTLVPYDGGAAIRTALLGNHVQVATCAIGDVRAIIESGDCFPMALIGTERASIVPNIPSTVEIGLRDVTTPTPRGFFGPKGMAKAQRDYLAAAFKAALENPACIAELNRAFIDAKFVDGETGKKQTQEIHDNLKALFDKYRE
jgi:tripartite-type tricarboxylate transporter receptor subunit TctC